MSRMKQKKIPKYVSTQDDQLESRFQATGKLAMGLLALSVIMATISTFISIAGFLHNHKGCCKGE